MRIALFGGTFDPIHRGHVELARAAADAFGLERVLVIPSGLPPHKHGPTETGYEHRYRMVELACERDARLEASRLEAPTDGRKRHYSIETIQRAQADLGPGQHLFFLIGSDAFAEIALWHRWRELIELVEFIVVSRPDADLPEESAPAGARVHWLRSVRIPISSTEIRRRLRSAEPVGDWLPPDVVAYIHEHGLYGAGDAEPGG